jgi:hypothetical protein
MRTESFPTRPNREFHYPNNGAPRLHSRLHIQAVRQVPLVAMVVGKFESRGFLS